MPTHRVTPFKTLSAHLKNVPLLSLKHHPKNPRFHDERNIQAIMSSLKKFKQLAPLVVWGARNYVIVGNGRMEAFKRLGHKNVDIVRADHLTEQEALSFMIADNKTTDLSVFDDRVLADIMRGLDGDETLVAATGFNHMEIEPLLTSDLPDMPEGFGDVSSPNKVGDIADKGSSNALGHVILVFETEKQKQSIFHLLGLDVEENTKQTFSYEEIPNVQQEAKKIVKQKKIIRRK
jgi:hypothetical protein